ncbi:hypothetical protein SNK03_001129 [Fusarium graminearum]|uniref:Chromosome 1, complete genome n=1 Tax=Gibberella zeae (strain ATCC MYA-4620 / CBS 123657 / FGSC 9075 / NRRL 31084 / PH-1) TaxID=229533 RepID=I1S4V3_GIBZE|nr:hypothetical protein FGSG_11871 [Fusarium graminearum PH-1]ESU06239.1 hypothetical protein FGSG_11871 [Fusarium graminearum PH-1]CEF73031.1 unnamed protein product [Fusarium graminearum]CZS76297.1 unnamed protein product [Fusarium graminearum]|eukprot:XP_011316724.1 hypothetical protein FGSG_11871 [Fusarium graminearum PH-1]
MIGQIESVIHSVKLSFDVGSAYESLESKSGDVLKQKSLRKRGVSVSGAVPAFAGETETETQRSRNCLPSQGRTRQAARVNGSSPGIWRAAAHSADDRLPIKKGSLRAGSSLLLNGMLAILYAEDEDPLSLGLIATSYSKMWICCT